MFLVLVYTIAKKVPHVEAVDVEILDNYVDEHNLDVGFIKVNIKGLERKFC